MRFIESLACRDLWAAVHDGYNLSSNDDTLTSGATVVYRQRDIEAWQSRTRGHDAAQPASRRRPLDRY
jgi:hypothetical protein